MPGSSLIYTASLTVQGSFSFLQSTPRLAPLLVPASPETSGTISKRQTLIKCQREHYRERTERNTGWLWWQPLVSTTLNDTRSLEKNLFKALLSNFSIICISLSTVTGFILTIVENSPIKSRKGTQTEFWKNKDAQNQVTFQQSFYNIQ